MVNLRECEYLVPSITCEFRVKSCIVFPEIYVKRILVNDQTLKTDILNSFKSTNNILIHILILPNKNECYHYGKLYLKK